MKSFARIAPAAAATLLACSLLMPASQGTKKTPVPDQPALDRAMKLLIDIFADDLKKATNNDAKAKLAAYLFQQGKEAKEDAAVRFVCYREASELAARGSDANLALTIVEELGRSFDIDELAWKARVLEMAVASAGDKEGSLELVELIRPILGEAVDLDHYPAAHQLGQAAINAAKKAKSPSLVLELQKRADELKEIEKGFAKQRGYLDRIDKNPGDAEAHFELAKYFAFQKKRWEKALPHFAKCGDKAIEALAVKDLAQPESAKEQLALADAWWALADAKKDAGKAALRARAGFWYEKAMPGLAGLSRTKAQKRIELVQDQPTPAVAGPLPALGPVGEFRKFEGHNEEIKGVALSHDGRHAASGSRDKTLRVYDLNSKDGKDAQVIRGHTGEVWAVAFHPNGRSLFSVSWDATARLWDLKNGNEIKSWKHPKDVNGLALSRDAGTMLTGCDDQNVRLWNVATGEEIRTYTGHNNYVYAVAFAPDGKHIASGGVDKTVRVFELDTGRLIKTFDGQLEAVTYVAFTSDSRQVLSAGDAAIHVWDLASGRELPRRFEGHSGRIPAMAISPDGRRLLTGGDDRTVRLWDVATGKILHTFPGHADTVLCVAFSPDGRRAISGGYDKTVRVWTLPPR